MPPREEAYFDTSVLVKQYVEEAGSVSARRLFLRFQVVSSALTPVEMMSALARRRAAGDVNTQEAPQTEPRCERLDAFDRAARRAHHQRRESFRASGIDSVQCHVTPGTKKAWQAAVATAKPAMSPSRQAASA